MKSILQALLLLVVLVAGVHAQPTIDPAFQPTRLYQPSAIAAACQLSDGSRIVAGTISRADGQPATNLVRYLANGTLDVTFAANVAGNDWHPTLLAEAPGGKLLVGNTIGAPMVVDGQLVNSLARLNADGTLDAGFSVGSGPNGPIQAVLVQADGKLVVGGIFTQMAGQTVGNLVRLNANGSLDTNFLSAGRGGSAAVEALAQQPDGKLLLGGRFRTMHGQSRPLLARLNPDGSLDTSLVLTASSATGAELGALALQPDGRLLVSGVGLTGGTLSSDFLRLTSSGAPDPSFTNSTAAWPTGPAGSHPLQVQSDGKIIISNYNSNGNGRTAGQVARLLADGSTDTSFQFPAAGAGITAVQLLPGGEMLVGSEADQYGSGPRRTGLALLRPDGSLNTSFAPRLQETGSIEAMVVQADGHILIGGQFDELNGSAVNGLARLSANGVVENAYTATVALTGTGVHALALQPDGNVVVGGRFSSLGGVARPGLARLLPSGLADPSFAPTALTTGGEVQLLAIQPDGQVLLAGPEGYGFGRISATGQPDPSFQPPSTCIPRTLLVQPDGRIVVGGLYTVGLNFYPLLRLQATGSADPSFFRFLPPSGRVCTPKCLALYPDGRVLVGGSITGYGSSTSAGVMRLRPNGTVDNTFQANLSALDVLALAVQPNQRILVGGRGDFNSSATVTGTARLLDNGSLDAAYQPLSGPGTAVSQVVVNADGSLLIAGSFGNVGTQPILGLTRLLDPSVLATQKATNDFVRLAVWPVPAHQTLQVRLDGIEQPHSVELLDMLGKRVLRQPLTQSSFTLTLPSLPAGPYVLRLAGRSASVSQRISIE